MFSKGRGNFEALQENSAYVWRLTCKDSLATRAAQKDTGSSSLNTYLVA